VVLEYCCRQAEGVDCLPNEEIFIELARMGYEKPSTKLMFYKAFFSCQWKFLIHTILQCMSAKITSLNKFSSAMASAIICLSTGKGFSRVETPLFEGMLVDQEVDEEGDANKHIEEATTGDAAHGEGRMIAKMDKDDAVVLMDDKEEDKEAKVDESAQVQGRQAKSQAKIYKIDMDHASKVLSMQEDEPTELQEVVEVVTTAKLIYEVTATIAAAPSRIRKRVVIRDPESESATSSIIPAEIKSKDKGKGIMVEKPKPLKKKQQIEQDEEYARNLYEELNKDID
nr:hypothetical protein [Tanacetum cinerariifolium]